LVKQVSAGERSADVRESLVVVAVVCGVTIWQGFVIGVGVGVLASLVVFIRSMNRSLIRARFTAAARPSRRVYSDLQEQFLAEARRRIEIRELEGALFFGSADRLAVEADALDARCRYIVLDLKRVSTIDDSGAVLLQQLSTRLHRRGISLLMAGVTERNRHGLRLRAFGCFREAPRDDWFADLDYATEAAEQALLAGAGTPWEDDAGVPLETCTLFRRLDPSQVVTVRGHMVRTRLARGEQLFRQNDPADRLYVLTQGSISIVAHSGGTRVSRRFAAFSPGVMLGETAMLDRGGRSADATADKDAEIYALTQSALDTLAGSEPEIAAHLYRNIAIHLSERLRRATSLQSADGS
jgi:ABC-type transporter Mla MlaB component